MTRLEEIEEELENLDIQRQQLIADAEALDSEIETLNKEYCELSPDYVKVICPNCQNSNLLGYVVDENTNKSVACPVCNKQKYIWMRLYKE